MRRETAREVISAQKNAMLRDVKGCRFFNSNSPPSFSIATAHLRGFAASVGTLRGCRALATLWGGLPPEARADLRRAKGGGPDRDRTGDLMNAIHARSQLRYWPTRGKTTMVTRRGPSDQLPGSSCSFWSGMAHVTTAWQHAPRKEPSTSQRETIREPVRFRQFHRLIRPATRSVNRARYSRGSPDPRHCRPGRTRHTRGRRAACRSHPTD